MIIYHDTIVIKKSFIRSVVITALLCIFLDHISIAQDHTVPGKLSSPYPTVTNLAVEWLINGDDNLNGVVQVRYRSKGSSVWKEAMPLRRIPAGYNNTALKHPTKVAGYNGFSWKNKHSGSIFDLQPGTAYEIKLSLKDPDGGNMEKTIQARTRPIPAYSKNAKIIDISPGVYDTLHTESGTEKRPVVYRCSKGEAVFRFIEARDRKWVFLEQLTVKNPAAKGTGIRLTGAENCVVQYCTVRATYGIVAYYPGATNCYISDNTVSADFEWSNEAMGAQGKNIGEGIQLTGSGNVICYNRVAGYRDCISFMEDWEVLSQVCNDIYNNDVEGGLDDGIEADFAFSNCRIMRNRLTNCYVGVSSQPGLGGPTYIIRNVMYNVVHSAFKLKRESRGDVVLHNTVIKSGAGLAGNDTMDHAYFRNNLAFGGPNGGINWGGYGAGQPFAANIISPGIHSSFDYDAVGVYNTPYIALIGGLPFSEVEKNGIEQLDFKQTFPGIEFPYPPVPLRKPPVLKVAAGARSEDAGILIPNINDQFSGKAPDCGAYEAGQPVPHYGPRVKN
jgi:hypothetical protein